VLGASIIRENRPDDGSKERERSKERGNVIKKERRNM
jgi:hypothetical protein